MYDSTIVDMETIRDDVGFRVPFQPFMNSDLYVSPVSLKGNHVVEVVLGLMVDDLLAVELLKGVFVVPVPMAIGRL